MKGRVESRNHNDLAPFEIAQDRSVASSVAAVPRGCKFPTGPVSHLPCLCSCTDYSKKSQIAVATELWS